MEKKKNRNYPVWIINTFLVLFSILGLFLILILVLYFIKFWGNGLSIKTADWGNFGDLLGGTLTPLLTIINILVLYRLTVVARRIETSAVEIQIKHQSYQAYFNKINELFFNVINLYTDYLSKTKNNEMVNSKNEDIEITLEIFKVFLENFLTEVEDLISADEHDEYKKALDSFTTSIDSFKTSYNSTDQNKRKKALSDFIDNKSKFIKIVNKNLKVKTYEREK